MLFRSEAFGEVHQRPKDETARQTIEIVQKESGPTTAVRNITVFQQRYRPRTHPCNTRLLSNPPKLHSAPAAVQSLDVKGKVQQGWKADAAPLKAMSTSWEDKRRRSDASTSQPPSTTAGSMAIKRSIRLASTPRKTAAAASVEALRVEGDITSCRRVSYLLIGVMLNSQEQERRRLAAMVSSHLTFCVQSSFAI